MQAFMQSLQMRCPVAAASGLSTAIMASAPIGWPRVFTRWNSEIFSSSGQPASSTPNTVFLKPVAGAFSFSPFAHESLPCSWHQMQ
jgi:hypothetical protein